MNKLLSSLNEVCQQYPLQEKILIVPCYSAGHELCEALARVGGGWVNLHPETTTGLAHQVACAYLAEKNMTLLTGYLSAAVIEEVFQELEGNKALQYFVREGSSPGLVRVIAASIIELRKAGVTGDSLPVNSFVSPKKGQDMLVLLKAYERYLEQHNYIDTPGLLALALQLLSSAKPAADDLLFILPSFLHLYPLELQLIESIADGCLHTLNTDPVYGLAGPGAEPSKFDETQQPVPGSDVERLPWLYRVDLAPKPVGDGSLSYFQAYGMRNEVREIFRRLLTEGLALDSVTVACTSSEYIPVFYSLARRSGVGLTVGEGIPCFLTGPGKVLQGLVDWIRSNYSAGVLRDMILCGDVQLLADKEGAAALSSEAAARLLRGSGIGWGRDRYVLLQDMAATLKERAGMAVEDEDDEGNRRQQLLRQSEQAEQLYRTITPLLASLPVPDADGRISLRELTSSLSEILSRLVRIKDETDAATMKGLVEGLAQAGQIASLRLEIDEALERVENLLNGFRVGSSGPRPGHLHLTSFNNLIWSNRPHTFIVGLDANTFPGSGHQEPVLLDTERRRIHPGLPLGADRPGENQYTLALALSSRRGRVTLSFPSFDIVENRQVYPSSVLLQVHRLLKGDASLDYTDLMNSLGMPAGYYPQDGRQALDEVEWWAEKILNKPGLRNGAAAVRACYRGIKLGQQAMEARKGLEPTEYDGVIGVSPGELDPRGKDDIIMSCSRIEYLAGCPFAYFLRYVLNLYPPDEIVYDPGRWLDHLDRGLLLHDLFCNFLKKIIKNNEMPALAAHRSLMMEMADELIEDYRKRIPPPGDVVYNHEVRDIHRSCEVFLTAEENNASGVPVLLEVPFGFGTEAVEKSGCGLAEPVEIELDDGTNFLLNGKIDRIDRVGAGIYHVWDYKTGSMYGYDDHKYLCGGRQVQHALYALAAERILKSLYPGEPPPGWEYPAIIFPPGGGRGGGWPARSPTTVYYSGYSVIFLIFWAAEALLPPTTRRSAASAITRRCVAGTGRQPGQSSCWRPALPAWSPGGG